MFVGLRQIIPDGINISVEHWADDGSHIARAMQWSIQPLHVLVDGTDRTNPGTIPIAGPNGVAIMAKDKATLLAGLKVINFGAKLGTSDGNLGFVTGSYDREKIGAWLRTRMKAKKQTGNPNAYDRERLDDRAYYVIVARVPTFVNNQKSTNLHQAEVAIGALRALITGQVTKEEAVNTLMQDLLIN